MLQLPQLPKTAKFFIALALQVLIILVIIIFKVSALASGSVVLLQLAPIDPRDPLRGDYLNLRYDISTVTNYTYNQNIQNGDIVYVPLEKTSSFWTQSQTGLLTSLPAKTAGIVYIKGTVMSGGQDNTYNLGGIYNNNTGSYQIKYNIESYFVPEGKGSTLDINSWMRCAGSQGCLNSASVPENQPFAMVAIDDSGNAVLKQLYVNQAPWPQGGTKLQLSPDTSTWGNTTTQGSDSQTSGGTQSYPNPNNYQAQTYPSGSSASAPVTVQWLPYKNAQFGYSLSYPSTLQFKELAYDPNSQSQAVTFNQIGSITSYLQIDVSPNTYNYQTLGDYANTYSTSGELSRAPVVINGKSAVEIDGSDTVTTLFMSPDKKEIYNFLLWSPGTKGTVERSNYDQILSSFNF